MFSQIHLYFGKIPAINRDLNNAYGCTLSQVNRFDAIKNTCSRIPDPPRFFSDFFFRFFSKNGCILFVRSQPFPAECQSSSTAIERPLSSSSVTHETFAHPTAVFQIIETEHR